MTCRHIPSKRKEMAGKKFGRLIVIEYAETNRGRAMWRCRCDCGEIRVVHGAKLRKGSTRSCGCLSREIMLARAKQQTTHGLSSTGTYQVWQGMRRRCNSPRNESFKDYGARGIKICDEWSSFENFLRDMGERPTPKHTIERIDNNGNYSPDNCKWILKSEQMKNTRSAVRVELRGQTVCMLEAAKILGVSYDSLRRRYKKGQGTVEEIARSLGKRR